ncbi:MAG TPA: AAA family ATPase [Anaerolineae bacterium]|nr:AAA family ATPase [Anaerolineae bacterium]
MRLNHLVLQGYKSFATKTEFLFPTGITAIVGPNGSGKSNIADAIRWVLGEQRVHSLRGRSTADMIFAGGHRRARAGMAEVSLTLDNADGWLPIEFSEVTLTRRAYRSGENEYLLNGSRVRLRDIAALLAESGLSQRAYTVIGQGLVDAALSLRPQERRTLFEEAAGISFYRTQREDAVQRLDETQRNLERVYDIISEITPRLRRLEREAERVEEHRRLVAHLERLQSTWYGYEWGRQQAALGRDLDRASALEASMEAQQTEASAINDRLGELRQEESELRASLRDWHRESANLHDQANEVQRELAVAEERTRLLKVRREELLAELDPLSRQQAAQADQVTQTRAQAEQLARDLEERRKRLAALEREWAAVQEQAEEPARRRAQVEQELRAHRAGLERLNQALLEVRAEAARLSSEQAVAEERARQLRARRDEIVAGLDPLGGQQEAQAERVAQARAEVERLDRALAERRGRLAELEREWAAVQGQAQEPEQQRARVEQDLRAHRAALERLNQALLDARAEAAHLAGEHAALSRTHAASSAYAAGVRALLQADLDGVLGPLAALIRVPPEWERAVEAALGADLQAVVVERTSLVDEVCQILESSGGRVALLPLDGLRPAPSLRSGAVRAADVVTCDERVRSAVETVLGGVALCEDLAAARALLGDMPPGSCCVTATGVVLRADGVISVGQAGAGGVLADEQARRELPARLEEVQHRCQEIEGRQRAEAEQIAALETRLQELAQQALAAREEAARVERETVGKARTEVAVAEGALHSQGAALQREEALLERLEAQMAALRGQADELEAEYAASVARLQEMRAESPQVAVHPGDVRTRGEGAGRAQAQPSLPARLGEIQRRAQELEAQQRVEAEQVAALEAGLQELAQQAMEAREEAARVERETMGKARTEVAVAGEAVRSQRAARQREEALLERLEAQMAARRQRAEELEAEHTAVVTHAQALRGAASEMEAQLHQMSARIQPAEEELARLHEEQATLEERERRARDRVRDTEARLGRAQLDVARCRDELKLLARRIEEDLGLVELELSESVTAQTPLPLRPVVSQLPIVEDLPEGLEEEIRILKARVRRLGSVNPNAPADYAEVQERHRFLTEQSADLEAASAQLRDVVAELDELMETAFRETFEAVAARFSETFTALFNGGAARLELTEPGDLMNTGVDIVARPPGKRAQRLALLSGGERALTAAALLFALLHVSPTPFCVLDEVDAMLDEANVGRFRALLEELAEQTQFIVITHNRVTTEAAHAIYGVSMGADAVSQVVSLQLD